LEDNILEDVVEIILEIRKLAKKLKENDYLEDLIKSLKYLSKTFEYKDVLKKLKEK